MKNFVLYNPVRVVFGNGESSNVGKHVQGIGKKAMIVSYEAHDFATSARLLRSAVPRR